MSNINIVIPLKEFTSYISEILIKNEAKFYLEKKDSNESRYKIEINLNDFNELIENNRAKNLNFFITTKTLENIEKSFYDDDICQYVIEGMGGRVSDSIVERISLRIVSKTSDKSIKKVFNSIKRKLKKDENIGMGVKGNSSLHRNYFYLKKLVESKIFVTDIYNNKAPVINILN